MCPSTVFMSLCSLVHVLVVQTSTLSYVIAEGYHISHITVPQTVVNLDFEHLPPQIG
jgi:hypothetical protein